MSNANLEEVVERERKLLHPVSKVSSREFVVPKGAVRLFGASGNVPIKINKAR
jgi:hypothetical protein